MGLGCSTVHLETSESWNGGTDQQFYADKGACASSSQSRFIWTYTARGSWSDCMRAKGWVPAPPPVAQAPPRYEKRSLDRWGP
jgi:hypothetical protein